MKILPLILFVCFLFCVEQSSAQTRVPVNIVRMTLSEGLGISAGAVLFTADNRSFGQTYYSPYLTNADTCGPCLPPQTFATNNFGSMRVAAGSSNTIIRFHTSSFVSDSILIPIRLNWKKRILNFYGNSAWVGKIEVETGIPGDQIIYYDDDVILEGSYKAEFYNEFPVFGRKRLTYTRTKFELNSPQ